MPSFALQQQQEQKQKQGFVLILNVAVNVLRSHYSNEIVLVLR
jgi:hypothetical protein